MVMLRQAKKEAYEETAKALTGDRSPLAKRILVIALILAVALVGADWTFVAVGYAVLAVAIPITVHVGKRHSRLP